jgi:hypothetical protein
VIRPPSRPTVVYLKPRKASRDRTPPLTKPQFRLPLLPPVISTEIEPESHRTAMVGALGKRLRIDEQKGFFLDGVPINLDPLMRETNRIRRANGLSPVGKNPRWLE